MATVKELQELLADMYSPDEEIAYSLWNVLDVQSQAEDSGIVLSEGQARTVLNRVHRKQDAGIGINWDVVQVHMEETNFCEVCAGEPNCQLEAFQDCQYNPANK
jgi:hypothetical protein